MIRSRIALCLASLMVTGVSAGATLRPQTGPPPAGFPPTGPPARGDDPRGTDTRGEDTRGSDPRSGDSQGPGPRDAGLRRGDMPADIPGTRDPADGSIATWWRWWELNRLPLLLPETFARLQDGTPSPRYAERSPRLTSQDAAAARTQLMPQLLAACADADTSVRVAAATAAGRLGGEAAVPRLLELTRDRSQRVRESALLALGATGSPQAAPWLLELASLVPGSQEARAHAVTPDARAIAWVALGLGRERGFSDGVGRLVVHLVAELRDNRLRELSPAALLYRRLSPSDDTDHSGVLRLDDEHARTDVRARWAESLAMLADPSMVPHLDAALHQPDLPLRRSAALALASFSAAGLLDELARHFDAEQDELLRGYLLLAIAQQEALPAAELLANTLHAGDALVRPWSALALGLLARREEGVAERAAVTLREEAARGSSASDQLAFLLASGLARDADRAADCLDLLQHSDDAQTRLIAAQALTLLELPDLGNPELRDPVPTALAAQLAIETSPEVRGILAQSLAVYHDAADVPVLVGALERLHAGEAGVELARGCGAHGTQAMLAALVPLVTDASRPAPVHTAAWQALGLLLDPQGCARLPQAMAGVELDALPDWCRRLLADSTL